MGVWSYVCKCGLLLGKFLKGFSSGVHVRVTKEQKDTLKQEMKYYNKIKNSVNK